MLIRDESDVVVARRLIRELGAQQGLSEAAIAALATAATELVRNIVVHAGRGELLISAVRHSLGTGVTVTACDDGPGIADITQAMLDGYSTGVGLGLGLPSAQRLVDEFEIESTLGGGTTVTLRKWTCRPRK